MSAVARIAVGRIPDMLLVPAGAIFTSEGRSVVYKRTSRGFVEDARSTSCNARASRSAVKNGLEPGDRLSLTRPGGNGKRGSK